MFNPRRPERDFFSQAGQFAHIVGKDSFYPFLAERGHRFVPDEDFCRLLPFPGEPSRCAVFDLDVHVGFPNLQPS